MKQGTVAHPNTAMRRAVKRLGFRDEPSERWQEPKIEVRQDDRALAIAVDVLGMTDVRVVLEEGPPAILLIQGNRKFEGIEKQHSVKIAANSSSKFTATLLLPPDIDHRTVDACFEGSLLMLVGEKRPRERHFNGKGRL